LQWVQAKDREKYPSLNFLTRSFGSGEFLLSGDEIKSTGKMKEGTVPVPLTTPALRAIMMYYLFRSYRIFGGVEAAVVKPLWCVQVFLNISPEPLFLNSSC
jgi:hypothetical protein